MRSVIQRVKQASVTVEGQIVGQIEQGLLILFAVHENDSDEMVEKMASKLLKLRVFEDEEGKMNKSVQDVGGELLVVSQFTLCGDCSKGNRPSFMYSARPEKAIPLYEALVARLRESGLKIQTGEFAAMMDVALVNDGPVTLIMDV